MRPKTSDAADPEALLPLTPTVFSILLALADGPSHGYAIMQAVAAETEGRIQMGPGTLYGSLDRMMRTRLVAEAEDAPDEAAPHQERRRYYQLTDFGQRVLLAEVRRLDQAVAIARRKKLKFRTA